MNRGRPRKWPTQQDLDNSIDSYLESRKKIDDNGSWTGKYEPITVSGFCVFCNTYDDVIQDYANGKYDDKDNIYSKSYKKLLGMARNYTEEYLFSGKNVAGAIFSLKNNYGWKDKTEQEVKMDMPTPIIKLDK